MKIFFLILTLFFLVYIDAYSQNQIVPSPKIYKNSKGRLFVNMNEGFYFKISTNSNPNSQKHTLKEENEAELQKIFFTKEGKNYVFSPSAVDTITKKTVKPKVDVLFEVYADGTAPKTTIHNNIVAYEKKDTLLFGDDLRIWFSANDNLSGVENIYYSINGQPYVIFGGDSLKFEDKKFYELKYYSVDNVGNVEQPRTVKFMINKDKPLTNLIVIGPHLDNIVHSSAKVALKPQDAFGLKPITKYYIDDQQQRVYSQPISVSNLSEGMHTLYYFSESALKTVEEIKSWDFYIDKTPPMVIDELTGDFIYANGKTYTTSRTLVQLTAIDNKAGVKEIKYSFDGTNWTSYTAPFSLPVDKPNVRIMFFAEDNVGNKTSKDINQGGQGNTKIFASEMDLTSPIVGIEFIGPLTQHFDTIVISNKTKIKLLGKDYQSGLKTIEYIVNKSEQMLYDKEFCINDQGYTMLNVVASDNVNNISTQEKTFIVDTTGPEIFVHFSSSQISSNQSIILPKGVKIFLAATDRYSSVDKITYKINGSELLVYNQPITINNTGKYIFEVVVFDNLQNKTEKKYIFEIR